MRIAFVGKGGSGKTTLTSLFGEYLISQNHRVILIDGDINQHLLSKVSIPQKSAQTLGNNLHPLKNHLKGNNKKISNVQEFIKTTPPGLGSNLLHFDSDILNQYDFSDHQNVRFFKAGENTAQDLGVRCYHSKTGSIEILLNHLIDLDNEYILVDMTAGADSFASGLFTKFDLIIIVAAPNLGSIDVYQQHRDHLKNHNLPFFVVANQIEDQSDHNYLQNLIEQEHYLTSFYKSSALKLKERGEKITVNQLENENLTSLQALKESINPIERDWTRIRNHSHHFHTQNSLKWANSELGTQLENQIDETFLYPGEK
ncbi:AAA family ATPase [Candidatus Peregrinibacteria bacterium]|nr:AAA family ATPase [Candidatus Peregrinibacteria bacterium]